MDDTISRQTAIDALQKEIDKGIPPFDDVMGSIRCGVRLARNIVEDLPSAQPEPQWIPCKTRLPKENDYRGCMECIDGAVWYLTDKGTIGLGYYYDSTKEWSTTDDLKPYGNVIAWCRIPEPWKGAEHETD